MEFFLVDVKSITPSVSSEQIDKAKAEKLADLILECNGLLKPLILKPTGPESYVVIKGNTEYYAALKAREKDPRKGEMVNAFIISPKAEEAVFKQFQALENPGTQFSSDHIIKSDENISVNKYPENVPLQILHSFQKEVDNMMGSLPSQLTVMRQQMEKNFQNFLNERLAILENNILEIIKKTNFDVDTQNGQRQNGQRQNGVEDYNKKTVKELKSLAKERKIKCFSKKKKAQLIDALEKEE